ncbi:hypothetical protein BDY19DRAFT_947765 [Irpex rosettiformis]|uniref:Uncharacterized protein n=1 Tax=Irpex rosettiformis TaxID=378272 RepID=A0ACB8U280_9APHY|nr:hypothetical protein BDY19DRAFT_947765 [Irpex rosettiformis]
MHRRTLFLWRAARLNVPGLPPCPTDLSEPAYASLVFDRHCMNCMSRNCGRTYWRCRVRLCKRCCAELSVNAHSASQMLDTEVQTFLALEKCTYFKWSLTYVPRLEAGFYVRLGDTAYKPHVENFNSLMMQTPLEERAAVLGDVERSVSLLESSADSMERWFTERKESRSAECGELRMKRREAILAKLTETGWQDEVRYLNAVGSYKLYREFNKLSQVRKPQELTPRSWTMIEGAMTEFMEKIRNAHFEPSRDKIQGRLLKLREVVEYVVPRLDIPGLTLSTRETAICVPEVTRLLNPFVSDNFIVQNLQQSLGTWIRSYLRNRDHRARQALAGLVRRHCRLDPFCDPFSLAVGKLFICTECRTARPLSHAVHHHCRMDYGYSPVPEDRPELVKYVTEAFLSNETFWHESAYRAGLERMVEVIELCGFDAKTATIGGLDQARVYIQGIPKNPQLTGPNVVIMDWRTAAIGTKDYDPDQYSYQRGTDQQVLAAQPLLDELQLFESMCSPYEADEEFSCAFCITATGMNRESAKFHLRICHGIWDPTGSQCLDNHSIIQADQPVYLLCDDEYQYEGQPGDIFGSPLGSSRPEV